MSSDSYFDYINKKFKVNFTENDTPSIICPHCFKGDLKLQKDKFSFDETPNSKESRHHPEWEPDWIKYRYAASFICLNCNSNTYSCGIGKHRYYESYLPEEEVNFPVFYPKYFEPSIPLFSITKDCPENIKDLIIVSFSLAWTDVSAAASKLRIAIELLLNTINPELTKIQSLHHRIKKFESEQPDIAQSLMAIKWLGNDASHVAALKEYDLAFAFEVMELVLNKLFDNSEDKLKKMVDRINDNKGKPFENW